MRVAVLSEKLDGRRRARAATEPGVIELRLGDAVLVAAEDDYWRQAERVAPEPGLRFLPRPVPAENLHLVVQLGNLFQRRWPNVPVLLDKGRYLVVSLPPEDVAAVEHVGSCCYTVRPIAESRTVFEERRPSARRAAADEAVQSAIARLDRGRIEADIGVLAGFPTRLSTSEPFRAAIEWARVRLEEAGCATRIEPVAMKLGVSMNLVGDRLGDGPGSRDLLLVTAHLDSVNSLAGGEGRAPGADDNASGAAGLIAIARALGPEHARHDLRFVLFGGEEQGLFGSTQYVNALSASERARIRAVVNMDMVAGRNTASPTVLLEGGAGVSEGVVDALAAAAATYTSLDVQTSLEPYNSDHVPFIDAGLPAVLTIEGADRANERVHTDADTPGALDYDLLLQILAMNVAFVAETIQLTRGDGVTRPSTDTVTLTIPANAHLTEVLRNLPFQLSGRYAFGGGASDTQSRGIADRSAAISHAALTHPRYRLTEPVYIEPATGAADRRRGSSAVRFTLHVDVDGREPLGVVSGTIAVGAHAQGASLPHFIGRVVSDEPVPGGRHLTVEDFSLRWPGTDDIVDRITVELAGAPLSIPTATVRFHVRGGDRVHGPYVATQESIYFRDVEVEVDREANAIECEPLSTHAHPDRPVDLIEESLTLETAFARAGIRVTRTGGGGLVTGAGGDRRWSYSELHDSMVVHWQAFANRPQWKMWIFLAELGESDTLGGVMFDGDIDEPGGVDRQGTAIFTRCPHFHTLAGDYIQANPPGAEAIQRELFFNLMHETGHAFNLAHSFQKELGLSWEAPPWLPLANDAQALSWMNYPDSATPGGAGSNASWFYRRFRFGFDPGELLFLRHAPESYVEMGAESWFEQHARVPRISVDPRLELTLRSRRLVSLYGGHTSAEVELGEPLLLELRLRNKGAQPVAVHANLDPSDGLVEVAITNGKGERRPYLPIDHTRTKLDLRTLQSDERIYQLVDLTIGSFGFPFKEPGPYRIEASYRNLDGSTAAAVLQVYVRPARNADDVPVLNELFDARIGRTLYVDGTRVMEDVNDKLDWVRGKLGDANPVSTHLRTVRFKPLARRAKLVEPSSRKERALPEQPDVVVRELQPVVDDCQASADTMGHIWFTEVVETYARAAEEANRAAAGAKALQQAVAVFQKRGVVQSVIDSLEEQRRELTSATGAARSPKSRSGRLEKPAARATPR